MTLIAILIVIAVIALFLQRQRSGTKPASAAPASPESALLRLCHGDAAKVERLIALELKAAPSISRTAAIERATYRLRRDNH